MEISTVITVAGWLALGFALCKLFRSLHAIVYPYLWAKPRDLHELAGGARWAVVTGSTDGIGKAYATELALRGFNLVLISRSGDKLDTVAEEIKREIQGAGGKGKGMDQDPEIRTVQFDFTDARFADYETKIFAKIQDIEVGILVNNVGMVSDYPARLHQCPGGLQQLTDVTVLNTLPATLLSAFVLRQMAQRGRGIIVNVTSAAALCHWYWYAVYSATKKCILHLSSILRREYSNLDGSPGGILIQTLCPMLVATKMAKRAMGRPSWMAPGPRAFAKEAIRTIGLADETTGCLSHQIQAEILFGCVPGPLFDFLMRREAVRGRSKALAEKGAANKRD